MGLQADVELQVPADLRAARLVGSTVARFAAVEGPVAEVSTVAEADMVGADTGKFVRSLI